MASLLHDSFGQCSPESAEAQTRGPHLWPSLLQDVYRPDDRPSNCGACRGPQVTGRLGLEENSLALVVCLSFQAAFVDREDRGWAITRLLIKAL